MIALNLIVRNEAHRIIDCLTRASAYCDELVVVDQDSDDDTAALARTFGALVLHDECRGTDEPSRPLCAAHTKSDWILNLHADEHLTDEAIAALPGIMRTFVGARFSSASFVGDERVNPWMGDHYHPDYQFRFYRAGTVDYPAALHSRIVSRFPVEFVFTGPKRPWIMNLKECWEAELDSARYGEFADASR